LITKLVSKEKVSLTKMQATKEFAVVVAESESDAVGQAAADAAEKIAACIKAKGVCSVVFGAALPSPGLWEALIEKGVDWKSVIGFQLDEFVGVEADDPRSSRFQLNDSLAKLAPFQAFHFIGAGGDAAEIARLGELMAAHPVDLAFLSIGESGQLGLNDLPNLEASDAYVVVSLSENLRGQMAIAEGHFKSKDDVPKQAVTLSLQQMMKCRQIVAIVTGKRKAAAVKNVTEGAPTAKNPAAFLQKHSDCVMYLDNESASLLKSELAKNSAAPAAAPGSAKGFVIRTFRPGQGWVEVGEAQQKDRSLGTAKMTPMEARKKAMAQKRLDALRKL